MGIKPHVVPVKVHSGILTFTLFGSYFCQGAQCRFSTLRASFHFLFHFFFCIFCLFSFLFFSLHFFLYFSLALTFAWVALPGFRPSEPLKGKSVALSMSNGFEILKSSESRRMAAVLQEDSSSALRACLISLPLVQGVLLF